MAKPWGVPSDGTGKSLLNDRLLNLSVVEEMSAYYGAFLKVHPPPALQFVTHYPTQARKYPKEHVAIECTATVQPWMIAQDVLFMATARGSHELLNKLPHPTEQMKSRVSNARLGQDSNSATMGQEEYEEEMRKYCMTLYREEVFKYVQQLIVEVKQTGVTFRNCPVEELKMWSHVMYVSLGFNLGSSLKRIQNWFAATGKKPRKKQGKNASAVRPVTPRNSTQRSNST